MKLRGNQNNLSPDWSEAELAILSAYEDPELPLAAVVARLPGRTFRAIQCKASALGIIARRRWKRVARLAESQRDRQSYVFNLSPDELGEFAGHRR